MLIDTRWYLYLNLLTKYLDDERSIGRFKVIHVSHIDVLNVSTDIDIRIYQSCLKVKLNRWLYYQIRLLYGIKNKAASSLPFNLHC